MGLSFKNGYTDTVYLSILWFDEGCRPDTWRKIGWWSIAAGDTVEIWSGDVGTLQNTFAWFAQASHADGPAWSGDRWYKIPHNASFNQCYGDDNGCNAVYPFHDGYVDDAWVGLTILLLQPGTPLQTFQGTIWPFPEYRPDPVPVPPNSFVSNANYVVGANQITTFNINTSNFNSSDIQVHSFSQNKQPEALVELIDQSIHYFESPFPTRKGELMVVGCGIRAISDMTFDAEAQIRAAEKVVYCVADPVTERKLHLLNPSAESLYGLYGDDKPRINTYLEMVEAILTPVRAGLRVCAVYYGHPGVFAWSTHKAVQIARKEGFRAEMHPGISADASLFADLGIDPSQPGCHSLEATDFLINGRTPDIYAHLLLWQVECVGDFGFRFSGYTRHNFPILIERLQNFYPANHPVVIYEATQLPQGRPKILKSCLASITKDQLSGISTIYLPPAKSLEIDQEMCRRLGVL